MASHYQEAEVVAQAERAKDSSLNSGGKISLMDWEPNDFTTHPALPGARVDPLLVPILNELYGANGEKQTDDFRKRIEESINKTDKVDPKGIVDPNGKEVLHGLTMIAVPITVGQSFVTHTNPKHPGEQRLYFHIDKNNPTAAIVIPDGETKPMPAHILMKHELAHVAQNRGGYASPLSAGVDGGPVIHDREKDAYEFEISGGTKYRESYGDGLTIITGKSPHRGIRTNPVNPSLDGQIWGKSVGWPEPESKLERHGSLEQFSPSHRIAAMAGHIKDSDSLTQQQKEQLYAMVAENVNRSAQNQQEDQMPGVSLG